MRAAVLKLRHIVTVSLFTGMLAAMSLEIKRAEPSGRSGLEATVKEKYSKKMFMLREFYADDRLYFDSKGSPLGKVHPGSWTAANIAIEEVKVSPRKVELRGFRVAEVYDLKKSKLAPFRTPFKMVVEFDRDSVQSDSDLLAAIDHVFLLPDERLVDLVPDYWKAFLSAAVVRVPQERGDMRDCEAHAKVKFPPPTTSDADERTLPYLVEPGITAPTPIHDPNPEYSALARSLKFEGDSVLRFVIKPDGHVADLEIIQPIGLGLDEQAVAAVQDWRFKPAVLNGHPVPVRVSVVSNFHLY